MHKHIVKFIRNNVTEIQHEFNEAVTAKEEEEQKTKEWTGGLAIATEPCVGSGGLPCVVF